MRRKSYSTYQVAKLCDVHYTTVINWVNVGKLKAYSTPGGHRRIDHADLIDFMERFEIPIPEAVRSSKKKVLIVDDDPEALEELGDALSHDGYELDFASDGFEAGRKIFGKAPDIILLDFKMPGMNGFEVCETLKMEEETAHIPVIAITILKSKEDVKRIKSCGVKRYMSKPVDVVRLLKVIDETLYPKTKEQRA